MNLTNDDIQEIVRLLDSSFVNELRIKTEGFDLYLRRSRSGWTQETQTLTAPHMVGGVEAAAAAPSAGTAESAPPAEREVDGVVAIRAPMVGTFYRAPKPGAPPFVEVGAEVGVDTIIGIVETMKLMNSVSAGAAGTVTEIRVANGQFVEADHVLMCLRQAGA